MEADRERAGTRMIPCPIPFHSLSSNIGMANSKIEKLERLRNAQYEDIEPRSSTQNQTWREAEHLVIHPVPQRPRLMCITPALFISRMVAFITPKPSAFRPASSIAAVSSLLFILRSISPERPLTFEL